ncbi:MAG: polysaccharide biosynthesis/export family protein [Bacteroidota bacterium]
MKKFNYTLPIAIAGILMMLFSSCATKERMVYFQDEKLADTVDIQKSYSPVFKKDDFISVIVTADDPEAAVPFNFPETGSERYMSNNGYTTGNPVRKAYLIDENGDVSLPVIGKLHLAGISRSQAVDTLEAIYSDYLSNPVVNIHIENFKITVLGDVAKPGTYKIPNERITILEAMGLAGDLNMTGERKNILVIRDNQGEDITYRIDLTSGDVLNSPVYYLEQNDVIYVEPNTAARSQGTFWRTSGSIFISVTSLIVTTLSILIN